MPLLFLYVPPVTHKELPTFAHWWQSDKFHLLSKTHFLDLIISIPLPSKHFIAKVHCYKQATEARYILQNIPSLAWKWFISIFFFQIPQESDNEWINIFPGVSAVMIGPVPKKIIPTALRKIQWILPRVVGIIYIDTGQIQIRCNPWENIYFLTG